MPADNLLNHDVGLLTVARCSASKSFCQRYTARLKCSERNGTSRDVNESLKITARGSDGSSISVTSRPSSSVGFAPAGSMTRARRGRRGTSRHVDLAQDPRQPHHPGEIQSLDGALVGDEIGARPGRRRVRHARAHGADDLLIGDQRAAVVPVRVGLLVDALARLGVELERRARRPRGRCPAAP